MQITRVYFKNNLSLFDANFFISDQREDTEITYIYDTYTHNNEVCNAFRNLKVMVGNEYNKTDFIGDFYGFGNNYALNEIPPRTVFEFTHNGFTGEAVCCYVDGNLTIRGGADIKEAFKDFVFSKTAVIIPLLDRSCVDLSDKSSEVDTILGFIGDITVTSNISYIVLLRTIQRIVTYVETGSKLIVVGGLLDGIAARHHYTLMTNLIKYLACKKVKVVIVGATEFDSSLFGSDDYLSDILEESGASFKRYTVVTTWFKVRPSSLPKDFKPLWFIEKDTQEVNEKILKGISLYDTYVESWY